MLWRLGGLLIGQMCLLAACGVSDGQGSTGIGVTEAGTGLRSTRRRPALPSVAARTCRV